MRAMSAPIRPNDAQTKKCFRRKKIVPMDQSDPFQFQFTHHQQQQSPSLLPQHKPKSVVDRKDEQISMRPLTCRPKIKVSKIPMQSRPQSAINGCDIVTLVSLLSPGGSDSEKEDHSTSSCNNKSDVTCTERRGGPSLRKMGKSGACPMCSPSIDNFHCVFLKFVFSVVSRWRRLFRFKWCECDRFVNDKYTTCIICSTGIQNSYESTANSAAWIHICEEHVQVIFFIYSYCFKVNRCHSTHKSTFKSNRVAWHSHSSRHLCLSLFTFAHKLIFRLRAAQQQAQSKHEITIIIIVWEHALDGNKHSISDIRVTIFDYLLYISISKCSIYVLKRTKRCETLKSLNSFCFD